MTGNIKGVVIVPVTKWLGHIYSFNNVLKSIPVGGRSEVTAGTVFVDNQYQCVQQVEALEDYVCLAKIDQGVKFDWDWLRPKSMVIQGVEVYDYTLKIS